MNNLWVTVPVGSREHYLPNLLKGLQHFGNRIVFVNNHQPYTKFSGVHHVEDVGPINIYRWWNIGINYAQRNGAEYVAVLNDDLEFDSEFLPAMHAHLIQHNLSIVDLENSGNGGGAAWMIDLKCGLRLDERYRWWYGDTDLFRRAGEKYGKFYYPNATHYSPNENLVSDPYLQDLVREDEALYRSLHAG